jgi:hypothetical protein
MEQGGNEIKQRDKVIADNESARQATSAVRLSTWAIVIAVLLGLMVFGWAIWR